MFGCINPDFFDLRVCFHEFLQGLDTFATTQLGWLIMIAQQFILHGHRQNAQQSWQHALVDLSTHITTIQIEEVAQECVGCVHADVHQRD